MTPTDIFSSKINFRAPASYKNEFSDSSCSLTVSVGQASQQGEILAATLEIINKHFSSCHIMVCDSLQRHTYAIANNQDQNKLHEMANQNGHLWIENNKKHFEILDIPHKVVRWDEWLLHVNFQRKFSTIQKLFDTDQNYQDAILATANQFMNRYMNRLNVLQIIDQHYALECCMKYLMEECAVMLLWMDKGYNFEIYPSKRNLAMTATFQRLIAPYHSNILRPVALEIRSRKRVSELISL